MTESELVEMTEADVAEEAMIDAFLTAEGMLPEGDVLPFDMPPVPSGVEASIQAPPDGAEETPPDVVVVEQDIAELDSPAVETEDEPKPVRKRSRRKKADEPKADAAKAEVDPAEAQAKDDAELMRNWYCEACMWDAKVLVDYAKGERHRSDNPDRPLPSVRSMVNKHMSEHTRKDRGQGLDKPTTVAERWQKNRLPHQLESEARIKERKRRDAANAKRREDRAKAKAAKAKKNGKKKADAAAVEAAA